MNFKCTPNTSNILDLAPTICERRAKPPFTRCTPSKDYSNNNFSKVPLKTLIRLKFKVMARGEVVFGHPV